MKYAPFLQEVLKVRDLTPSVLCDDPSDDPKIKNKLTLVSRGNCTFLEKANLTQRYGGRALVIVSEEGLLIPGVGNDEHYDEISIPVAVLSSSDHSIMTQKMGPDFHVQLFSPNGPRVDYNLILIWVLAVGTVILGSIWSGKVRQKLSGDSGAGEEGEEEEDDQTGDLDVSPTTLMVFVVLMCGMLVSLYFFYDYLVYVLIGLFVVASSTSMYAVLKLALIRMPCIGTCKIPENRIPLLKTRPEIRRIILFLLCLAFGIFWAVERHESYAWILQDILGIFFCINMMKTIRMPSFKACTVLLCMLFVYDIFFVFITPLFTKSGESIMVDVATGGSSHSGEMLPMVLKVPRFMLRPETRACTLPHSLLGFGDILVPGLLVSYNFGFDLIVGSSKTYFIVSAIGYGLGLITTFIALALMATGQPALLYLVPFTLLPTLVVAVKRKEVKRLWEGPEYGV
ncbi:hypothetical protein CAPTEDRAFT_108818 [Capitella teleta]|uniref:PA domain-containing protein n=1 Tax=Capitella teleta TaxID=283909 RepID=R7TDE2_CAPTE|nr:hypothetical protein CAPTEDRAFT_108818 [Capitella teleta]|eukprot:ELT89507.1 hypothetical protein CAPTEDRAFT_108818 [Capitella teleta]